LSTPFDGFAALDRTIHEPARLALLTALSGCVSADFLLLQRVTGLTKGNLSVHLSKLEAAGLVEITKEFVGKKPRTVVSLTDLGAEAVQQHWQRLDALREAGGRPGWGLDPAGATS
jgi:DNA-binding transcriptional ArsR family regulator